MKRRMVILLLFISIWPFYVKASDFEIKNCQYSEEYIKWLSLSEEERKTVIEPHHCDLNKQVTYEIARPFFYGREAVYPEYFSIKDCGYDSAIKNQMDTGTCWTFAANETVETFMKKSNSIQYDLSERHMEYSLSRTFLNNETNGLGLNRNLNEGGNYYMASAYYYRGQGPIDEKQMPFENNWDTIELSKIENKDTIVDVDSIMITGANTCDSDITSTMKNHLMNYGSLSVGIYMHKFAPYYNNVTASYYYNGSNSMNHLVTIVGWDNTYEKENFYVGNRPSSDGAWIVKNSWGSSWGDDGYFYISYEDVRVCQYVGGVISADDVIHDNSYLHDSFGTNDAVGAKNSAGTYVYAANVFTKNNNVEILKEVMVSSLFNTTVDVYLIEDGSKDIKLSNAVYLGSTEIKNGGYQTIKISTPQILTHDKFTIIAAYNGKTDTPIGVSAKNTGVWNVVTSSLGNSYFSTDGNTFVDFKQITSETFIPTIKAETDTIDYSIDNISFTDPHINNIVGGTIKFNINTTNIDDNEKLTIKIYDTNNTDVSSLFSWNDVYIYDNKGILNLEVPKNVFDANTTYTIKIFYEHTSYEKNFTIYEYKDLSLINSVLPNLIYNNQINELKFNLVATNYDDNNLITVVITDGEGINQNANFNIKGNNIKSQSANIIITNNINITPGTYNIKFILDDFNITSNFTITEYIAATEIVFLTDSVVIGDLQEYKIEYEVLPKNATDKEIIWQSSSNAINVSDTGVLTVTGRGTAEISATLASDYSVKEKLNATSVISAVNITNKVIEGNYQGDLSNVYESYGGMVIAQINVIDVNDLDVMITKGNDDVTNEFDIEIYEEAENSYQLSINISKNTIASTYCVKAKGSYYVDDIVLSNSSSGEECFEVKMPNLIEEIIIANIKLEEFDKMQLEPIIKPQTAMNKTLKYTSSNPNIVSVSETGELLAKAVGNVSITIESTDGSGVSTTFDVIVSDSFISNAGYNVSASVLKNVSANTLINDFYQNLKVPDSMIVKIYNKNHIEKLSGCIATGDYIVKTKNDLKKTYQIIVIGDINSDGKININDLILVRKHLAGISKLSDDKISAADVNSDGKVTINDVIKVRKSLAGLGNL